MKVHALRREPFCACYANGPLGGSPGEGKQTNGCTPFLYPIQMKKFLSLFILSLCFSAVWAHDVEVDGIYYNLNKDDNTASVTYKGYNHDSYENEYTGDVVIPETINVNGTQYQVTSLGWFCFSGCSGLTSISIPNSVTSLLDYCFSRCSGLTSITISNSVTSLGAWCFQGCSGLESITVEEGNSIAVPNYPPSRFPTL